MIEEKLTAYIVSDEFKQQQQSVQQSLASKLIFHPPLSPPDKKAAILIPFIMQSNCTQVLLTQRAQHLNIHAGQIAFPGGRLEEKDRQNLITTAVRETHEETGLAPSQINVLEELGAWPSFSGYMVTAYIGFVKPPYVYTPCPNEVAEVFEVPLSHILDITQYEQKPFSRGQVKTKIYYIDYQERHIWGFTAGVLYYLAQILQPIREALSS